MISCQKLIVNLIINITHNNNNNNIYLSYIHVSEIYILVASK